jgi:hypothetical protein
VVFDRQGFDRCIGDLLDVVEHVCGLNAQTPRGLSVGLWSRVNNFEQADLDATLQRHDLVKANLMRGTVHLVTRRQYRSWRSSTRRHHQSA